MFLGGDQRATFKESIKAYIMQAARKWLTAISWIILLIGSPFGSLVELATAQDAKPQPTELVILQSSELNESSGVAQVGELLWTHNDSGDKPRLFAFASDGSLRVPWRGMRR